MAGAVLKAHGDVSTRTVCQDHRASGDGDMRADYLILVEGDPDWRAVCEDCSYGYDWDDAEVEIDL